ncbi:MAG: CRISPR-associated endonuclease Cas1 [Candidatus Hydrogenedentes bacterium]|nr:CRISPR-associated endonuclease Cas1 [Candidatus Hydrogenedentota bacterium]
MSTYPSESPYLTTLRGLNEFVYCPRLFHLMYVQGLFEDSLETVEGRIKHAKRLTKSKAAAPVTEDGEQGTPWPMDLVRALTLSSTELGITGKFDVVLSEEEGHVPVEVKHGPAPEGTGKFPVGPCELPATAWGNDQVQLAAQMLLLQGAGHRCTKGRLYYQKTKTLVELDCTDVLREVVRWVAGETRALISAPMPAPLRDSRKCIRCSLNHVCLPDETLHLTEAIPEPRQLYPGRDDCGILHLITPGTRLGKRGEAVAVTVPGEKETLLPMKDVAHVSCWGNAQISTQVTLQLVERGIGITWLTGGGWIRATTTAPLEKNVQLRREQYRHFEDEERSLALARWVVTAKIENQRVLLRRNGKGDEAAEAVKALKSYRERAKKTDSIDSLRGLEGIAAKTYWDLFPSMLLPKDGITLRMNGRNRRPPKDPVNTLLSFGYSMLLRDFMTALHGCGLDPLFGFYHALVPGRPALALDMMEAFRPLVVDSAVLRACNEGRLGPTDFVETSGFCTLKPHAKKAWIKAYEGRVDELVTHPIFDYRLSYRRIFTLESRLLGRYLTGEIENYHPMTTR